MPDLVDSSGKTLTSLRNGWELGSGGGGGGKRGGRGTGIGK